MMKRLLSLRKSNVFSARKKMKGEVRSLCTSPFPSFKAKVYFHINLSLFCIKAGFSQLV
jgi:hypothetical protein